MAGGDRGLVKLSFQDGGPTVNTLPVGLEGNSLTLVCPFPLLRLEVPVRVLLPGGEQGEPVPATIRRVAVEMEGEEGIPRFKLHLELADRQVEEDQDIPIVVDVSGIELEADGALAAPPMFQPDGSEDEVDMVAAVLRASGVRDAESSWSQGDLMSLRPAAALPADDLQGSPVASAGVSPQGAEISWCTGLTASPSEVASPGALPAWLGAPLAAQDHPESQGGDPPWATVPAELAQAGDGKNRRRFRRRAVRTAVGLVLLLAVGGLGVGLGRPLVTRLRPLWESQLSAKLSGQTQETKPVAAAVPSPVGQAAKPQAPAPAPAQPVLEATDLGGGAVRLTTFPTTSDEESLAGMAATDQEPKPRTPADEADKDEGDGDRANGDSLVIDQGSDHLRILLPTQWPVTQARSYRTQNPSGIVVDVPGGTAAEQVRLINTVHERVRSIRVLERRQGVRFIIVLTDPTVPRYRVGYTRSGVAVDIFGPDPRHEG